MILAPHDIVQPDLLVVGRPDQVSKRGIEEAPLLAVEILSPSTHGHDRNVKARRYAALGVLHYRIVDPDARRVECYRAGASGYELVTRGEGSTTLAHPGWSDLTLDLATLWR